MALGLGCAEHVGVACWLAARIGGTGVQEEAIAVTILHLDRWCKIALAGMPSLFQRQPHPNIGP